MTESIWRAVLDRYEQRGTVSERIMANVILRLLELDGSDRIIDRVSSELLEAS